MFSDLVSSRDNAAITPECKSSLNSAQSLKPQGKYQLSGHQDRNQSSGHQDRDQSSDHQGRDQSSNKQNENILPRIWKKTFKRKKLKNSRKLESVTSDELLSEAKITSTSELPTTMTTELLTTTATHELSSAASSASSALSSSSAASSASSALSSSSLSSSSSPSSLSSSSSSSLFETKQLSLIDLKSQLLSLVNFTSDGIASISLSRNLIIFDWDDTLLPTSNLSTLGYGLENNLPLTPEIQEQLSLLESLILNLIKRIYTYGTVCIVTNSQTGWVELSAKKFFPKIYDILIDKDRTYDIEVISARSLCENHTTTLKELIECKSMEKGNYRSMEKGNYRSMEKGNYGSMEKENCGLIEKKKEECQNLIPQIDDQTCWKYHTIEIKLLSCSTRLLNIFNPYKIKFCNFNESLETTEGITIKLYECKHSESNTRPNHDEGEVKTREGRGEDEVKTREGRGEDEVKTREGRGENKMKNTSYILSFGDSLVERHAVQKIAEKYRLHSKTLKFVERPSIIQLQSQIKFITEFLPYFHSHNESMDLMLSLTKSSEKRKI